MATTDKGTQLMGAVLLTYLSEKPNLEEYLLAYVSEMDFLLEQIESVYLNRFLENAEGAQLDVIGEILNQSRRVVLPQIFFGFLGATGTISGMSDEVTPSLGGMFRNENDQEGSSAPLTDTQYKRLLCMKAACMNQDTITINQVYHYMRIILGFAPSHMELQVNSPRNVSIELLAAEVPPNDAALATYASRYFAPAGSAFSINLT